jgi:hypothetical protein
MTSSPTSQSSRDDHTGALAVVRWRDLAGAPVSSYPLPRPLADGVARAFAAIYPRESFWVEDVPWLAPPAPAGATVKHERAAARVHPAATTAPSVVP